MQNTELPSVATTINYGVAPGCPVQTIVRDARAAPLDFLLDECGFQLTGLEGGLPHVACWEDRATVARALYPAAERVAQQLLGGATAALAFDHRVRRSTDKWQRAPVFSVHTDIILGKAPEHVVALLNPHVEPGELQVPLP